MPGTKATKATAYYRDQPKDGQHCAECRMFRPPAACSAVDGVISAHGWCRYFKAKHAMSLADALKRD